MALSKNELREYLDFKTQQYNTRDFIDSDPIKLPHRFTRKEDIEIVAFLVSTIAWGNRTMIIKSGERMLNIMGNDPYNFIVNYESTKHLDFVHRTFNGVDLDFFFRSLKNIYANGGLELAFSPDPQIPGVKGRIIQFRTQFLAVEHEKRSEKHISNPAKNSASKRLNMFIGIIKVAC